MDLICSLEQCFTRHIHAKILNWGVNVLIDRFVCSSATNRVRKGYSRWLSLMFSFKIVREKSANGWPELINLHLTDISVGLSTSISEIGAHRNKI